MRDDAIPTISLHREGSGSYTLGRAGTSAPVRLLKGSQGLGVAPMTYTASPRLAGHGSSLRGRRANERDIFIPIIIDAPTMSDANALRDSLISFLSPLDERPLLLRLTTPGRDGYREIPIVYSSGLEGDYGEQYHGDHERRGIVFKAHDALWGGKPRHVEKSVDPATKPFLSDTEPFFPVVLSDSVVDAQLSITVLGDAPTFPVWTVTPPGTDLAIEHTDVNGRTSRFTLTGNLTETVTIDMAAGTITSPSYPNQELWERVVIGSSMFQLSPGANRLRFSMVGATAESMVHVVYTPQHLAGY